MEVNDCYLIVNIEAQLSESVDSSECDVSSPSKVDGILSSMKLSQLSVSTSLSADFQGSVVISVKGVVDSKG